MSFLHPEFLYYMLPPLFILFALLLTQKESQAEYFSEEVMSKLRVSANTLTLKARNALFLLMGVFMILALAQPVIKEGTVEVKAKSADIMIALDISDSMLATDVYPNRLEAAKQKALALLDETPNERIGIVAFAKNSYLVSPLSFDTGAVAFLLRQLDTTSITEKGTDFLSVIDIVSKSQKEQKKKYLLILSDGGDKSDFSEEIELAKEQGVTVFILGIATKKGAPIKLSDGNFIKHNGDIIISKLNENIIDLATKTGGVYIQSSTSSNDIKTMLREITNISDEKELKSEEIQRFIPLFYYPVAIALIILLIATSSISKRQKSSLPSVFVLFILLFSNLHVEAGMLDFMELNKAKEAYEKGDFENSAKLYEEYAKESGSGEGYYNSGNAYYKQKKYKEALQAYKKATFDTPDGRAKNFSNIGNAYVKEASQASLEKAVEAYEKSLEISEDKNTRENLEAVKKLIEKQKQDSKEDKKEDSDKKEQDKKDKDSKDNDKKDGDKKDGDKKESEDKQKKESDEKDENKEEKDSSKSEKSKDKQKNKDDMKSKEEDEKKEKEKSERGSEEKKKDDLKELEKDKSEDSKSTAKELNKSKMSDAEEQKWMQQLNTDSNTYLYQLNKEKPKNSDSDEKPW
ncbi:VWA domain-containing protein [Candidatus Sulfurimonas marisnigri]|uniref:VWA domain-containing protein n=1 Tax=Candidatus Sulfurimonas marisnigri TaxID=2740405 RepID=A0A7S7M1U9_9BACT|nr:VWA domain-containing protein [Candidatus Sulfurimonas marisnigri]QOY55385.1 VWA domain-containing protein [Candidatus Sulfurimonas marisnigri]